MTSSETSATIPGNNALQHVVAMFYHLVDLISLPKKAQAVSPQIIANAFTQIEELFSEATYLRCDRAPMQGKAIGEFYRSQRNMIGHHILRYLQTGNSSVSAAGEFHHHGGFIRFCDLWHFGSTGKVHIRETYLATGSELIEGKYERN